MGIPAGSTASNWHPVTPEDLVHEHLFRDWEDITVDCHIGESSRFDKHGSLHIDVAIPNADAARMVGYLRFAGLPLQITLEARRPPARAGYANPDFAAPDAR